MRNNGHFGFRQRLFSSPIYKLGCVVRMVVDSILPHAESGPNDHRKRIPVYRNNYTYSVPLEEIYQYLQYIRLNQTRIQKVSHNLGFPKGVGRRVSLLGVV